MGHIRNREAAPMSIHTYQTTLNSIVDSCFALIILLVLLAPRHLSSVLDRVLRPETEVSWLLERVRLPYIGRSIHSTSYRPDVVRGSVIPIYPGLLDVPDRVDRLGCYVGGDSAA